MDKDIANAELLRRLDERRRLERRRAEWMSDEELEEVVNSKN